MSFVPSSEVKRQDKLNKKVDPTKALAAPVTQDEDYCAELDGRKMDFSYLRDRSFIVAVSTGARSKPKLLASTMRGPFDFSEMCEAVGAMYQREQHHAKVYVLEKSFEKGIFFLDEGTMDYIEAYWEDIVLEESLEAAIFDDDEKEEVIPAGAVEIEYNEENKND